MATVEVFVNARYGYDIHTEVTGTEGTVSLTSPYGISRRTANLDGREVKSDFVARFVDAYRVELASWVQGVRSGVLPEPSAWDAHLANLGAFAAVDSLRGGGRVEVPQEQRPDLDALAASDCRRSRPRT